MVLLGYSAQNNVCLALSREVLAFEFLKRVCQHFEASPDLGTALVLHAELLLQRGKELLGKQKIEDIIAGALFSLHTCIIILFIIFFLLKPLWGGEGRTQQCT